MPHNRLDDEYRPFIEIAADKGLSLSFDVRSQNDNVALECVDMDLVCASIENAIDRATQQKLDELVVRLQRLLRDGTPVQQVDFVLGSRRTYYFPEDIEKMIASGPTAAHPFRLQRFSWLRCRPLSDGSHECQEYQNQICLVREAS